MRLQTGDEPGASHFPVALHSDDGNVEYFRDFMLLQTAEKSQFDHTGCTWIGFLQLRQSLIQHENVFVASNRVPTFNGGQTQALLLASALACDSGACVVDQDSSHRLGGYGEEVCAIFK